MKIKSKSVASGIASYELGVSLGEGGAGIVFAAVQDDEHDVAVKVLRPKAATSKQFKRFSNELHFCLRTRDPRLVAVLDYGRVATDHGDTTFYVMPRYSGTLRTLLDAGLVPATANALANSALDCVEAAHLRRVWHRDLKPANLLVEPSGLSLVLSDFGIAHFHEDQLATSIETGPQERFGSFQYAAPEQRTKGGNVDHRSDLFSLGLIIHELFTGEVPQGKGHKLIASVAPEYGYLDQIVEWLTQQSPSARPASVDEVRLRLLALAREVGARRQLSALEDKIIARTEADDPLIESPPRVVDFDPQGHVLHLKLSAPPTPVWVDTFKHIRHSTALRGAAPEDFSFSGARASVGFTYNQPTLENIQRVIDDFKRFLDIAASDYKDRIERERREADEAALKRKQDEMRAQAKRLEILRGVKI